MAQAKKKRICLKLIVIGESNVGKTSLLQRFLKPNQDFLPKYKATIGAEFLSKDFEIDEQKVTLQIWDTAGQERFQSLGKMFYRGADGVLLVFDLQEKETLDALEHWMEDFLDNAGTGIEEETFPWIVLGNKADLDPQQVTDEEANKWCEEHSKKVPIKFLKTSAKTKLNLNEAFEHIARLGVKNHLEKNPDEEEEIPEKIDFEKDQSSGGCC